MDVEDDLFGSTSQNLQTMNSIEMEINVGQDAQIGVSSRSPSKRGKKSKVWKYFDKLIVDRKRKARCKRCKFVYSYHGTTNLKRHITDLCKHRGTTRPNLENDMEFEPEVFRDIIAEALMTHNLPFKFVEYAKIRKAFSYLNPNVKHICRNTAKADVIKKFSHEKENIKKYFESINGRICLTSDLWTSITSKGYISVTAHFVDNNWILRSKLLVFRYLPPPHDGESVGEFLIALLKEWGIEKKVFTITLDNASYNDVVVDMLKHHFLLNRSLVSDGDFLHVRCCSHIMNLIVQSGLKAVDGTVGKLRETIKYIKWNDARVLRFFECVDQVGLKRRKKLRLDVSIRWNSTFSMLDGALLYKRALCQLKILDKHYKWCPTEEEWRRIEKITNLLRPFSVITELFSGTKYPTANVYFKNIWRIQSQRRVSRRRNELEKYLADPPIDRKAFRNMDVLEYWKNYSTTSPALSAMARDSLSVPITTIASESAFSHASRLISKHRSSILSDNAEAVLCGRDWFGDDDSEEEYDGELLVDVEKLVEDLGRSSI